MAHSCTRECTNLSQSTVSQFSWTQLDVEASTATASARRNSDSRVFWLACSRMSSYRRKWLDRVRTVHKLEPTYRESINQLDTTRCGGQQSSCKCTEKRRQPVFASGRSRFGRRVSSPREVHSICTWHAHDPSQGRPQRIQPEVAETRALQLHGEKATAMMPPCFVLPQEVTNGDRRVGSSPSTGSGLPCLRRPDNECYTVQVQR